MTPLLCIAEAQTCEEEELTGERARGRTGEGKRRKESGLARGGRGGQANRRVTRKQAASSQEGRFTGEPTVSATLLAPVQVVIW